MLHLHVTGAVTSLAGTTTAVTANVRTPWIQRQRRGRRVSSRVVSVQGSEACFRLCFSTLSVNECRPAVGSRGGSTLRLRPAALARMQLQAIPPRDSSATTAEADYTYTIPLSGSLPADAVAQAQAAAEAEHQKLMTTGPLAKEMARGNKQLQGIMGNYGTLQRLYHKAVLPIVQQHGQLATSNVDLAYSIYCDLLGRYPGKRPGDTISSAELKAVSLLVKSSTACQDQHMTQFADYLCQLGGVNQATDIFVIPHIVQLLLAGFLNDDDVTSEFSDMLTKSLLAEDNIARGFAQNLASASLRSTLRFANSQVEPQLLQALLAMCQPASLPPDVSIAFNSLQCAVSPSLRSMMQLNCVIDGGLCLLSPTDQQEVLQSSSDLYDLLASTHGNVYMTVSARHTAGTVMQWIITSVLTTYWATVMRKTAFEQLSGSRPVQDWKPVQEALDVSCIFMSPAADAWLTAQKKLASLATGASLPVDRLADELNSMSPAMGPGGFWAVTACVVSLDMLRASSSLRTAGEAKDRQLKLWFQKQTNMVASYACKNFLSMLMTGMLKVIDSQYSCWSSLWYWMSLVTLSLQQTGGKQGPQAVTVAEQLMKEKHSVFVARLCLQVCNAQLHSPSVMSNPGLVSAGQLLNDPALDSLIIARGDPSKVATLNTFRNTPPSAGPASLSATYQQAADLLNSEDASKGCKSRWQKCLDRLLLCSSMTSQTVSSSELLRAFADLPNTDAGVESSSARRALSGAFSAWLEYAAAIDVNSPAHKVALHHVWFPAGVAINHIYTHSSSRDVAEFLLGPGAVEEQYVRPLGSYLHRKAVLANSLIEHVGSVKGIIFGRAAATLLLSGIPSYAPVTKQMIDCIIWLTAAALSRLDSTDRELLFPAASMVLRTAYRIYILEAPRPRNMHLVLAALDACLVSNKEQQRVIAGEILWRVVCGSSPFYQLDAPLQALMQVTVTRWIKSAVKAPWINTMQLTVIGKVPLLHAEVYAELLGWALMTGDNATLQKIWSAAVSASTNPQLSVTPAFGGRRPGERWLVGQLVKLLDQLYQPHTVLLQPVMEAVQRLLQDPEAANAAAPPGWLLLDGVCSVLASYRAADPGYCNTMLQKVVDILLSHQQIDKPTRLPAALQAAAAAGAAGGDLNFYQLAVQKSQALKLTADDVYEIRSAAIAEAATQAAQDDDSCQVFLQLWSDAVDAVPAVAAADVGETSMRVLSPWAAAAVVSLILAHADVASQLLTAQIPLLKLLDLVKAAIRAKTGDGLVMLLKHARQHNMLQQLVNRVSHSDLDDLMMVITSSSRNPTAAEYSWEVYLVLQQSGAWLTAATPIGTLDALLQQQGNAGLTDRVLQLWTDNAQINVTKLSSGAQSTVLSALVQSDQQQEAVDLIKQMPQQLGQLVTLWQQQAGRYVTADVLLQALQLAISQADAAAAESILHLVRLEAAAVNMLKADSLTAVHLVQLLSSHGRLSAAKALLINYVLLQDQSVASAATAVVAYITGIAPHVPQQPQHQLIMHLHGLQQDRLQGVLSAALDKLLHESNSMPAAVAIVLWLLTSSSGQNSQQLPSLLTSSQFEQLCILVSRQSDQRSISSSSSTTLTTLPGAADLAQQCIKSNADISPTAAVTLINSIAADDANLQPARAAEILEVMHTGLDDAVAVLADGGSVVQSIEHVPRKSWTIAQLCYQQLPGDSSSTTDMQTYSTTMSPSLSWISQLTPEAAAAALFAAWYWAQASAGESTIHPYTSLTIRPPVAAAAVNLLCLELYQAARSHSRPKLNSLLLDLGLIAAAAAQQWEQGAAIISTAERAAKLAAVHSDSSTSRGSKSSFSSPHWIPLLPAALTALPAVMVHTQGVAKTAELLLEVYEQQQTQQQEQPQQSHKRKGRVSEISPTVTAVRPTVASVDSHSLLSPACISSFFSASVNVAMAAAASGDDDAAQMAAAAAVKVAHALYGQQLVTAQLAAANGDGVFMSNSRFTSSSNDTSIYSSLQLLYGLNCQLQQVADITMTAVHGQLRPLDVGSSSSSNSADSVTSAGDALQQVLAGSAAALLSAGAAAVVFDLLDGLTAAGVNQVTHKQLVEKLIQAAEVVDEEEVQQALSCRLSGGSEAAELLMLCSNPDEVAQEVGGGGDDGDGDAFNDKDNGSTNSLKQVYLRLVARKGLEPSALTQQLQQRLKQAGQ